MFFYITNFQPIELQSFAFSLFSAHFARSIFFISSSRSSSPTLVSSYAVLLFTMTYKILAILCAVATMACIYPLLERILRK